MDYLYKASGANGERESSASRRKFERFRSSSVGTHSGVQFVVVWLECPLDLAHLDLLLGVFSPEKNWNMG